MVQWFLEIHYFCNKSSFRNKTCRSWKMLNRSIVQVSKRVQSQIGCITQVKSVFPSQTGTHGPEPVGPWRSVDPWSQTSHKVPHVPFSWVQQKGWPVHFHRTKQLFWIFMQHGVRGHALEWKNLSTKSPKKKMSISSKSMLINLKN